MAAIDGNCNIYCCRPAEEDLRASLFAFDQPPEGRLD